MTKFPTTSSVSTHTTVSPNEFQMLSEVLVRWEERDNTEENLLKAWLYFCPLFHCKCYFVRGCQLMEMCAHSLAASLMCWASGPPASGVKHSPPRGFKEWSHTGPVAFGSAYLMEGIWLQLESYLNIFIEKSKYLQTYVVCLEKKKCWI